MFVRSLVLALLGCGLASSGTFSVQAQEGRLLVLSVGVEPELSAKGKNDPYARDAGHVSEAFAAAKPLYKSVHTEVVNGNNATHDAVVHGLRELVRNQRENDLGVVFFSCHGGWNAKDGYSISLAKTGKQHTQLPGRELLEILGHSKGKVIVLLDTCCAAGVIPPQPKMNYTNLSFLTACKRDEGSSGSGSSIKKPHGCFVVALTEALSGRADANSDGIVTFGEVHNYLPARAKEMYNEQNAVAIIRQGAGQLQLAKAAEGTKPGPPAAEAGTRNPFGMADIERPLGKDVIDFAKVTRFAGGKDDENAGDWAEIAIPQRDDIEGRWSSRWRTGDGEWATGQATVKIAGERVFIMYHDGGSKYMIEARRNNQRLVGRYVNLSDEGDSSPWVGRILDNGRIDGAWISGRWDLRRKFE